jgi:hypothetical protein
MDYISPARLMEEVEAASTKKAAFSTRALVLKGFLSGALLAYATALAFKAAEGFTTGTAALISGAVFPVVRLAERLRQRHLVQLDGCTRHHTWNEFHFDYGEDRGDLVAGCDIFRLGA